MAKKKAEKPKSKSTGKSKKKSAGKKKTTAKKEAVEAKKKVTKPAAAEEVVVDEIEDEDDFEEEVILTDADGNRICRVAECDQVARVDGYCRYHYLAMWKRIQARKKILTEGKLEKYIEELTARYPDKFLEILRKDLKSAKDFMHVLQELEIDDIGDDSGYEEDDQTYMDEIRGVEGASSSRNKDDDFN